MNMDMDRKSLRERLFKHEGFLYKIEKDDEDIYYFLGYYICSIYDDSTNTIYRYNKMLEAIQCGEKEEISNQFRKIISRSREKKEFTQDVKERFKNLIESLDDKQFNDLKQQVNQFEELWRSYGVH